MLPSSFWPCQRKNGSKWLESWWLDLEERLLPNGFPSKKWDGRSCSVGRWVEMNLHNRPLRLPLLLYVPYVSIYRGGIVLWKIMTKLHSINKLGMVKKSTWSLKAWWKVLRLWITNMCIIDRQTDRQMWNLSDRWRQRGRWSVSGSRASAAPPLYLQSLLTTGSATLAARKHQTLRLSLFMEDRHFSSCLVL